MFLSEVSRQMGEQLGGWVGVKLTMKHKEFHTW